MDLKGSRTEKDLMTAFAGGFQAGYRYTFFASKARQDRIVPIAHETVLARDTPVTWRCRNCGYLHHGTEAPSVGPACADPQAQVELLG